MRKFWHAHKWQYMTFLRRCRTCGRVQKTDDPPEVSKREWTDA